MAKIHDEFNKNKHLMQMLVNKVEADKGLIEEAHNLRLSLTKSMVSGKESKAVQTDDMPLLGMYPTSFTSVMHTQEAAGANHPLD